MTKQEAEITLGMAWKALRSFLQAVLLMCASLTAVFGSIGFILKPYINDWVEDKFSVSIGPVISRLDSIEITLNTPNSKLPPFIEFFGDAQIANLGPYVGGDKVPITYQIRRNEDCETTVIARWFNADAFVYDTTLTYSFRATNASVTSEPTTFTVHATLPDNITAGKWAYHPRLLSVGCANPTPVVPPMSDFFDVVVQSP